MIFFCRKIVLKLKLLVLALVNIKYIADLLRDNRIWKFSKSRWLIKPNLVSIQSMLILVMSVHLFILISICYRIRLQVNMLIKQHLKTAKKYCLIKNLTPMCIIKTKITIDISIGSTDTEAALMESNVCFALVQVSHLFQTSNSCLTIIWS